MFAILSRSSGDLVCDTPLLDLECMRVVLKQPMQRTEMATNLVYCLKKWLFKKSYSKLLNMKRHPVGKRKKIILYL